MPLLLVLLASLTVMPISMASKTPGCPPFPSSMAVFSASFAQPEPPLIKSEYKTNFVQHKWNQNLSHITTGLINNSPSKLFVRVDEVFEDSDNAAQEHGSTLATSLFNYANVTNDGLVDNTLTSYTSNSTKSDVWRGYVNSNFPIIEQDMLVKAGAVFGGLTHREFVEAHVAAWNIMYQGVIPVTIFVDNCGVVVGYDYFSPGLRTRVVTEYFNIQVGGASS